MKKRVPYKIQYISSQTFSYGYYSIILILFAVYARPFENSFPQSESPQQIEIKWSLEPPELNTKELKKFVEANPNSAANPPDKTQNFSFRDQQAAQLKRRIPKN